MKKNIMLTFGLSGLMMSAVAGADGILSNEVNKAWRPVIGLGGGGRFLKRWESTRTLVLPIR